VRRILRGGVKLRLHELRPVEEQADRGVPAQLIQVRRYARVRERQRRHDVGIIGLINQYQSNPIEIYGEIADLLAGEPSYIK
jgi:hypothetical protein